MIKGATNSPTSPSATKSTSNATIIGLAAGLGVPLGVIFFAVIGLVFVRKLKGRPVYESQFSKENSVQPVSPVEAP